MDRTRYLDLYQAGKHSHCSSLFCSKTFDDSSWPTAHPNRGSVPSDAIEVESPIPNLGLLSAGAVASQARNLDEIIAETLSAQTSGESWNIDYDGEASMEKKKKGGILLMKHLIRISTAGSVDDGKFNTHPAVCSMMPSNHGRSNVSVIESTSKEWSFAA